MRELLITIAVVSGSLLVVDQGSPFRFMFFVFGVLLGVGVGAKISEQREIRRIDKYWEEQFSDTMEWRHGMHSVGRDDG